MEIRESSCYHVTAKPPAGRVRNPAEFRARSTVHCVSTLQDETCKEESIKSSCILLGDDAFPDDSPTFRVRCAMADDFR